METAEFGSPRRLRAVQILSASADVSTRQQGLHYLRTLALMSPESERPDLQAQLLERATDLFAEIASEEEGEPEFYPR